MKTTTTLGLGLVAAALSLAACTPPAPSASPSSPASAAPAPSASAAPTTSAPAPSAPAPVVTPSPAPPAADYDFTRLEFLHVGEVFATYAGRSDVSLHTYAECPWLTDVTFPGQDPNVTLSWLSTAQDPSGQTYDFVIYGDTTATPGLRSPVNAEGIGVGTPLPTVLATYPGAVEQTWNDTAFGTETIVRVKDPASNARYFFSAATPTGPVFRIDFGLFPTENTWPIGYDCAD